MNFLQYATSKDKFIYDIIHLNFAVYYYLDNIPTFQLGSYYDNPKKFCNCKYRIFLLIVFMCMYVTCRVNSRSQIIYEHFKKIYLQNGPVCDIYIILKLLTQISCSKLTNQFCTHFI